MKKFHKIQKKVIFNNKTKNKKIKKILIKKLKIQTCKFNNKKFRYNNKFNKINLLNIHILHKEIKIKWNLKDRIQINKIQIIMVINNNQIHKK